MSKSTNIFIDGVLMDVDVSFWSGSKVLKAEDLGLDEKNIAEAYRLGKKMLIPKEVIRAFRRIEGQARFAVESNSFRFPIGNARFIPKKRIPKVLNRLQDCRSKYMGLVDDLIQKYEIYRKEMLPIYTKAAEDAYITQTPEMHTFGPEYDREAERNDYVQRFLKRIESYYPPAESLRYKFDLSWSVYEIAVPRMKKTDLNKLADKETKRAIAEEDYKNQIHAKIGNFVEDVVKVLRQETVEVCNRVTTNIKEGKVISGRTVASLKQFIDKFSELNFVGDDEIESQLEKVRREFLDPNNATTIQGDEELKEELGRRLGEIAEKASNITDINSVTGEYRRKISWE